MSIRNSSGKSLNERVQIHSDGTREYWRDVPGRTGSYRASDHGRIKSLSRVVSIGKYTRLTKTIILSPRKGEYMMVGLHRPGCKQVCIAVHRIILETFVGPRPEGMEACHNDGNPTNNHLSNLRWDTRSNNNMDKAEHGTLKRGESHYLRKLTDDDVRKIRRLRKSEMHIDMHKRKYTLKKLAEMFGVDTSNIWLIVHNKAWSHVK